nr:hypothetical protein [Tanacetum cinerariifolium]
MRKFPNQKKKIIRIDQLTEASSKNDVKENPFIHVFNDYDHEMILKSKDWFEIHNPEISTLEEFWFPKLRLDRPGLGTMKLTKPETQESLREDHRTSDHSMYVASLKNSKNYKAQPYQYASPSKHILKVKAKPFPPCAHYGFNDHHPDDCRMYPKCKICGSYDHTTSEHNRVILVMGGVIAESS